ncbi:synaptotagmin-5-like [Rosa chinensis]|uniref:synaptotagmin-5-like n=1 Tax=Rosa chinensis TaxID=74649 RepID=UPI000D089915|nr:synaptotagmin-5-like [Rosa chinensis]
MVAGYNDGKKSKNREEIAEIEKMHALIKEYNLNGQFRWISSQTNRARHGELYRYIADTGGDSVTLELEMQWDGNPSIILAINTLLGVSLPVQVKDIGFTGVFRLIFKPLVDQFPCFGAVSFSCFIPGLQDQLEGTIRDAIEDSITWPVRKVITILPGDYSDLELKTVGILEVKLVQAKELTNKDVVGKSDPYALLYVRPLKDRMRKSRTINNDLSPIWNEHFEFVVEDESTQHLVVKIFDDEASELIGCAQVQLSELQPGKVKDVWLTLVKSLEVQRDNKKRGQVHLELLYVPYGMDNGFVNPFTPNFPMTALEKVLKSGANGIDATENEKEASQKKKEVIIRGVLSITVISTEDLPPVDLMGKADPYVSLNPVWNQTFDFVVEDGLHDMLILEVYDHDTFGKDYMGRCILAPDQFVKALCSTANSKAMMELYVGLYTNIGFHDFAINSQSLTLGFELLFAKMKLIKVLCKNMLCKILTQVDPKDIIALGATSQGHMLHDSVIDFSSQFNQANSCTTLSNYGHGTCLWMEALVLIASNKRNCGNREKNDEI